MENKNSVTAPTVVIVILAVFYANEALQGNMYTKQRPEVVSENALGVYDYVIVGGGAAGCVLATRLSENKNNKVLLIEAGGFYDENPNFHILAYAESLKRTKHDWGYYTEPQKHAMLGAVDNRAYWPRGRVLGGSSMLNDGLYVRGSRHDYDSLAQEVGEDWSYKNVLPYFLKTEEMQSDSLSKTKYHNVRGQMAVTESGSTPLAEAFLNAGKELGYNITDYNGMNQQGVSKAQISSRKGIRESSAVAVLGRVRARHNLNTVINAYVTSIAIENNQATGVNYLHHGENRFVKATKEVILCAGAIKTPQLLMLSGIGPKAHLEEMNIPVKANLPVGQNLQDHLAIPLFSKVNKGVGYSKSDFNGTWSKIQHRAFGVGPLSKSTKEGVAFLSTTGTDVSDVQGILSSMIIPIENLNFKTDIMTELSAKFQDSEGFTFQLAITKPRSKGFVKLQSKDPLEQPILDPQYLVDSSDIADFIAGIRLWEKLITTSAMKAAGADASHMKVSFCEQQEFQSDAFWECMVRHLATTTHDQSCTCKMGSEKDNLSVVNNKLQVHGVTGLRVADASVFPNIPSGNINAPTVMIAEKAADIIQGIDSVKDLRKTLPTDL